ncbi:MAG: carbohydrate binding domain-containing protein [Bacteroidota bacterium]
MKHLLNKARAITILILMLSIIGCENDDDNLPKVIAGFTYTLNADTGTVTFINISENAGSYNWDFGDGATSNEINPIKTYANGTYTVVLTASNASGASATFEDIIIISIPNPITLPVTFDDPNVAYEVATFGGTSFEIVDNPDVSGTNDKTTKVGVITNSGETFEGINFDLGTQLDLTENKTITMNFWADAPVDVLLKLEQGTGDDIEVTASHGGTGWEVISFDFDSSDKYVRITIFVDGPGTTAGTFYIDDIIQIETPPATCIPETTQSLNAADFNLTFQTDPGASVGSFDAALTTVSNPDPNEVNNSCQVGQIDRNGGALFANNQIEFDSKLDFDANAGFKLKVWSPSAGTNVLVKLEDKTNSEIFAEVGATTSSAGAWEELTFDFASDQSGDYDKIVLFFELNTNTTETYYIDDFRLYERSGGGGAAATFPLDFEDGILFFNAFEGAATAVIDNPQPSVNNPSSKVLELVKPSGAPFFAGINSAQNLNGPLVDLANGMVFKVKVWSPKAGILIRLRLEQEEGVTQPPAYEVFQTLATANEWVTLTFDFTDQAMSSYTYTRLVLNADWDSDGGGETYYFDDIEQVAGDGNGGGTGCTDTELELPIDFDCEGIDYASKDAGDVDFEVIDNPELSGINATPSKVARLVFDSNQPWENMNLKLDTPISFATEKSVKLKLFSSTARAVKLKFETGGAPVENDQNHSGSGWEELTFTLASAESYSNLILFVDGGSNTVGTFYIDDIEQVAGGGGNGGGTSFIVNGGFETGDDTGWLFFNNGGTTSVTDTENNGGTFSAKITSGQFDNPGIKQERFGIGTILPNTQYEVQFDTKVESLIDGAIVQAFAFSESAVEGDSAVQHPLGTINVATGSWNTNTLTFTTADNVTGGVSLLIEVVCGGADTCNGVVYIDNVSFSIVP